MAQLQGIFADKQFMKCLYFRCDSGGHKTLKNGTFHGLVEKTRSR